MISCMTAQADATSPVLMDPMTASSNKKDFHKATPLPQSLPVCLVLHQLLEPLNDKNSQCAKVRFQAHLPGNYGQGSLELSCSPT
jgi:hypothetical protein